MFTQLQDQVQGKAEGQDEKKKKNEFNNLGKTRAGRHSGQSEVALRDLHDKTKTGSAPWTGSTQWLWVKQGYLERQLSDSGAVHPLRSFRDCTYGRDNR